MEWRWTQHILIQLNERDIRKELVELTLTNPDKTIAGRKNRMIYQKVIARKLFRVITEGDLLITVYMTDKIKKYMEDGN